MVTTDFGIGIIFGPKGHFLINPVRNEIYKMKPNAYKSLNVLMSRFQNEIVSNQFFKLHLKDTLYFIGSGNPLLHVAKMHMNLSSFDTAHPQPLYEPIPRTISLSFNFRLNIIQIILATISTLALAVLAFIQVARRKKVSMPPEVPDGSSWQNLDVAESRSENGYTNMEHPISQNNGDEISYFLSNLSATENNLLKMIIADSLLEKKTDINAINKVLGVANKDTQIQKTRRSVVINKINETFIQTTKINATLIDKVRDEFDKRSFVYFVQEELAKVIIDASKDHA